jgi:hypothetical protein
MIKTLISVFIGMMCLNAAFAVDEIMPMAHRHDMNMTDTRVSLNLSDKMKQHQLADMRAHLEAIDSIVGLMAENKFAEASKMAHEKLGLSPEMQRMCNMLGNEKATAMGLAFHKSGDELGGALSTGDLSRSLSALHTTMQYCVECHATFRQ